MSPLPLTGFSGSVVCIAACRSYTRLPPRTGDPEHSELFDAPYRPWSEAVEPPPPPPQALTTRERETPQMRMAPVFRICRCLLRMGLPLGRCGGVRSQPVELLLDEADL